MISGNSTETCGGANAAAVFDTKSASPPANKAAGWVGCYTNSAFNDYYYTSSYMTGETCRAACGTLGYAYAGTRTGNGCACGNSLATDRGPYAYCTSDCAGNSTETCGAAYNYDVYKTEGVAVTPVGKTKGYVGCTSDWDNKVTSVAYSSSFMTPAICTNYCKARNYKVAAVGFGNRCKCGNTMPGNIVPNSVCSAPCTGDATEFCGAAQTGGGSTYDVEKSGATGQFDATAKDATGFIGCFQEGNSKVASILSYTSDSNTPAVCASSCKALGHTISGVENGNQCYCTKQLNATSGAYRIADNECNTKCPTGDAKCGGSYKLAAYVADTAAGSDPGSNTGGETGVEGYIGCYLPGSFGSGAYSFTASFMSTGECRRSCRLKGFPMAGLVGGNKCQCGDPSNLGAPQPLALCSKACSGNNSQVCGGNSQFSLYDTYGAGSLPPKSGFPDQYLGCYQDSTPRQLPDYKMSNVGMTSAMCKRSCSAQNLPVYGTSGIECYCGKNLPANLIPDSQCSNSCGGIPSEKCGGSWRLSVYATDYEQRLAGGAAPISPNVPGPSNESTTVASSLISSQASSIASTLASSSAPTSSVASSTMAASSRVTSQASSTVAASSAPSSQASSIASSSQVSSSASSTQVSSSASSSQVSSSAPTSSQVSSSSAPVSSSMSSSAVSSFASTTAAESSGVANSTSTASLTGSLPTGGLLVTGGQTAPVSSTESNVESTVSAEPTTTVASASTIASSTTASSSSVASATPTPSIPTRVGCYKTDREAYNGFTMSSPGMTPETCKVSFYSRTCSFLFHEPRAYSSRFDCIGCLSIQGPVLRRRHQW